MEKSRQKFQDVLYLSANAGYGLSQAAVAGRLGFLASVTQLLAGAINGETLII